ncbi:mpv17-like protein 2 [Bombyx mori]|uniref:Mpv17-like protein 2 n=1 Tax=Bombyx mori TaxID=7091 RepID=A0A8R2AU80_BOMMO|nr:mpv17-like protein 2 [Bombyx mori]
MFALNLKKIKNVAIPLYRREQTRSKSLFNRGLHFLFKKNLLLTNSITSGGFMAIGDLFQQEFEFQSKLLKERYDWARAVRMFIVGTVLGPMHHYYYIYLDKVLPKNDVKTIFKKILYDETIVSPLTIVCFFYIMGTLEKKSLEKCNEEITKKFKYVYLADCLFWPPVQYINFYYLPTQYRVVYVNLATMVFNVFMSYMKHYDQHLE